MILELPINGIITSDGDYAETKGHSPGRPISIECCGEFDGAQIKFGFISRESTPAFVLDLDGSGNEQILTSSGRVVSLRPSSGKPAIRVLNASLNTNITIKIIDLLPR